MVSESYNYLTDNCSRTQLSCCVDEALEMNVLNECDEVTLIENYRTSRVVC